MDATVGEFDPRRNPLQCNGMDYAFAYKDDVRDLNVNLNLQLDLHAMLLSSECASYSLHLVRLSLHFRCYAMS